MKKVELYGDGIGYVEYIDHMGTDTTVVNAARVSFGKHKQVMDEKDERLLNTSSNIVTLHPLNTAR